MRDKNEDVNVHFIFNPNEIDRFQWGEFVKNHSEGNIFQTPEMFAVYQNTPNYSPYVIAVFNGQDQIKGLLVSVIQKEGVGLIGPLTSRSIVFGGPLVNNDDKYILDLILSEYKKMIKRKVIYTQVRNLFSQNFQTEIFRKNGFKYEAHLNIIQDLRIGEEKLWNNLSPSRRKGIRKAQKQLFDFEEHDVDNYINEFLNLLTCSYRKIKLPLPPKEHFLSISRELPKRNHRMFILKYNDEVIVSLVALVYKKTIYGYYVGTTTDQKITRLRPMDLFFWELFKWAIKNKFHYFDWMGAGKPNVEYGVREFKLQFGGQLVEYGRYTYLHKALAYKIIKRVFDVWRKA